MIFGDKIDKETYSFLITFFFNLFCFTVVLLSFDWLRKKRDDKLISAEIERKQDMELARREKEMNQIN